MYFLGFFFLLINVLVSVGFFTLLERKGLSYIQYRSGPNKLGFLGLMQPFSDGASLFFKEFFLVMNSNYFLYFFFPFLGLIQSLFMWLLYPFYSGVLLMNNGLLVFLVGCSLSIYSLMFCGWSSNSIYSLLGSVRSIAQSISYEVSLSLVLICYFLIIKSYSFFYLYIIQEYIWFFFLSTPLFLCWLSCCMAESNRSPFDFSEGESELVSGFNVEYGSGGFAILFISEYSSMIFLSLISVLVFIGGDYYSYLFYLKLVMYCFIFIWIRSSLPRYRYDKLMILAWSVYLPLCLNFLIFFIFLSFLLIYHFFLLS